jgi:hypothetical protein
VIASCVEELQTADQACFACLGELASPLSAKYHQQHEESDSNNAVNKSNLSSKSISKLEDDILHLYVFSWTVESQSTQTSILDKYSTSNDSNTSNSSDGTRHLTLERTQ